MEDREKLNDISDTELVELFNQASSLQEKLQYFSKIQDENCKIELLKTIPEKEKYKFIGKLEISQSIAKLFDKFQNYGIMYKNLLRKKI